MKRAEQGSLDGGKLHLLQTHWIDALTSSHRPDSGIKRHIHKLWAGCVVAVLGTVTAAVLRWLLDSAAGEQISPFTTFYPVVIVSALFGGTTAGLLATALTGLIEYLVFLPPISTADRIGLLLSGGINVGLSVLGGTLRAARHRMATEAHRLEQEKAFSESVISSIPGLFYLLDEDMRLVRWNKAFETVTGYSADELHLRSAVDLLHPSDAFQAKERFRDALETGEAHVELSVLTKDRRVVPFLFTGRGFEIGTQRGVLGIGIDVMARKEAEKALRESESRLRASFDNAAMGIVEVDERDRFVAVNNRACELLGYSREELLRMNVHEITAPEDRPRSDDLNAELHADRVNRLDYEKRYLRRDGSTLWAHVTVSPVRDANGRFLRHVGTIEDIQERKEAEESLRRTRDELLKANENLETLVQERTRKLQEMVAELEYFSYTLTHDMRAPLRAMKGFSTLLLEECEHCLNPERAGLLNRIAKAAYRMDLLITDALSYNRAVREQLELSPVDVGALLREMRESYPEFNTDRAEIQIQAGIPPVLGNRAALTQCFSNLLNNAVKFVEPGRKPCVSIGAEPAGEFVRINVRDNGIGIAPEFHDKIFGLFQQLSTEYEGTGIGLALVRKVVERMQGRVGVESEAGKGSRFWLELKKA